MASSEDSEHLRALYRAIKAVIRRIPRGRVATYGQIAELAGIPGGARIAAAALKTSQPSDGLPWQRVVGKAGPRRGRIAIHDPVGAAIQRQLLTAEGVQLTDQGLLSLDTYVWLPVASGRPSKPARPKTARQKSARPKRSSPKQARATIRSNRRS